MKKEKYKSEKEKSWTEFLTSGDINSYLAYKKLTDNELEFGKDLDCGIKGRDNPKDS